VGPPAGPGAFAYREAEVTTAALQTRALSKSFGGFAANTEIDLTVARGARHALIGPNGAGKTTLINLLTGFYAPSAGDILLEGVPVTKLSEHQRVKRGMTRTFQINTLFPRMTALQSVMLVLCERESMTSRLLARVPQSGPLYDEASALLESLRLLPFANTLTRELPYGRQRLLEIALGLANRPRVLLLDEPAAGIPSSESFELFDVIAQLPREVTIVFIEHDMDLVFRFAERITVLVGGRILTEGTPGEVSIDPRVREVYLGEAVHD
jgi:branched-chain amino acid transport system ATP-binding protein